LKPTIDPPRETSKHSPPPDGTVKDVISMRTSLNGRLFIINEECLNGVSNHLHHPSSGSGVTLGPGYDMKDRTETEIVLDLQIIGLPKDAAAAAAKGASLSGSAADAFVKANHKLIDLTNEQEAQLLAHIVPKYEAHVKRNIKVPVHQYEFDALVSFAYNPGGGWHAVSSFVNQKKYHEAMMALSQQIYSKHEKLKGLINRRRWETNLFLYGVYK
jgi:GH24 family phage-related lysozyme (muramidase)